MPTHSPVYTEMKEHLRRAIINRKYLPGDVIPSEHQLCRKFGISRRSVREALAELLSESFVYKVPGKGTFVTDREMKKEKAYSIAVGVYEIEGMLGSTVVAGYTSGIGSVATRHGYRFQWAITNPRYAGDKSYYENMVNEGHIDGIIIHDDLLSVENIKSLRRRKFPFVLLDRIVPGESIPSVSIDYKKGTFEATRHLLEHGHVRIGYLSATFGVRSYIEKKEGYLEALESYGLNSPEDYIVQTGHESGEGFYPAIRSLLEMLCPPTAVVGASAAISLGVVRVAKDKGLCVPEDLAIVSCYDISPAPLSALIKPSLSAGSIPAFKVGRIAAEKLFAVIDGKDTGKCEVRIKPVFVIRESCGCKNVRELGE